MSNETFKGPACVCISRRSSNVRDDYFVMTIEDGGSGCDIVEIEMSPAALALALSGAANQPALATWRVSNLGMRRETKTVVVPCTYSPTAQQKADALAPFEVNGWRGDASNLGNQHKRRGEHGFAVTFRRWVKPDGT